MYKTCIIGAGAAGLIAAAEASSGGDDVMIIDKNKKAGTKLYATGNGRCNLANLHMAFSCYYDNDLAAAVLGDDPAGFVIDHMRKLGIGCYDKNGYIYPRSNQASSVVWALLDSIKKDNVCLKSGTEVKSVREKDGLYIIYGDNENEICRAENIILATGGHSMPGLGAADEKVTHDILEGLSIKTTGCRPSLCPIVCEPVISCDIKAVSGVRSFCRVTVKLSDGTHHTEDGEVQFTDYGLSGIVIFDLSYYDDIKNIVVDTLYNISEEEFISEFNCLRSSMPSRTLLGFLNGYINDKLAAFVINCMNSGMNSGMHNDMNSGMDNSMNSNVNSGSSNIRSGITGIRETVNDQSHKKINPKQTVGKTDMTTVRAIYHAARNIEYKFIKLYGYEHSQVTKGGIDISEIDPLTMNIIGRRGLYAVGEAVDVCGKCGGYNLMWAFRSGYLAGRAVSERS